MTNNQDALKCAETLERDVCDLHDPRESAAHIRRLVAENEAKDALLRQAAEALKGYDLDAMCEAFHRCIEAQAHSQNPFHHPINADAMTALRILRGFLPAMKYLQATAASGLHLGQKGETG